MEFFWVEKIPLMLLFMRSNNLHLKNPQINGWPHTNSEIFRVDALANPHEHPLPSCSMAYSWQTHTAALHSVSTS